MTDYSFLAVSDVHLGWKLYNLPELAEDLKGDFARAVDLAISLQVDYFFIVGDLFDINKPSPDLVKFVSDQVKKLGANGCIAAGIAGDHDKPINNAAWIHLTRVLPIKDLRDPRFVGFDYCDNSMDNVKAIDALDYKDKVEWIFLHGHVPELFGFPEEKKLLDLKQIDLIKDFPALKGVILGDIHQPTEGTIHDPKMVRDPLPYIGYCGSLGMVKSNEIGPKKQGLLHYDGKTLKRVKFNLSREFIKMDLSEAYDTINWVQKYTKFFQDHKGKPPVIVVEYDIDSKSKLADIAPLYDVAIVKTAQIKRKKVGDEEVKETVNIRSEIKTNDRVERVLKEEIPDKVIYDLTLGIIKSEDPTAILDKFKEEML